MRRPGTGTKGRRVRTLPYRANCRALECSAIRTVRPTARASAAGRLGRVKPGMGVEIVLHQSNFLCVGKCMSANSFRHQHNPGGVAICDFDVPPALSGANIMNRLAVPLRGTSSSNLAGVSFFQPESALGFRRSIVLRSRSRQTTGKSGSRARVHREHVFHGGDEGVVAFGGITHCCLRCGLRMFF